MKKLLYSILLCLCAQMVHGTGPRNLMLLNNWKDETLEHGGQLEAISQAALTAFEQKAGAIVISSQTWRNIIGRGVNPIRYNEWIVKKLSDYIYLFVPKSYLATIKSKKDSYTQNLNTVTPLSQDERDLGLKIDKFPSISQNDLFNVAYHKSDLNINDYKNLTRKSAHATIQYLISSGNANYGEIYVMSQHVLYMLGKLLITRADVVSKVDPRTDLALFKQETEANEALLLHEWLVYLDGHGSKSQEGFVQPVVVQKKGYYPQITDIGVTSGLEHNTFQSLLKFFNGSVVTGALLYTSCYAGGPHLAKLFEQQWDAFLKNPEKQVKKDSYNYLIIMTNIWYTETYAGVDKFSAFFSSLYAFIHPAQKPVQKKYVKGKKKQVEKKRSTFEVTAQLSAIISYVTQFDLKRRYQVPGVRFAYTEWFVAIDDPTLPVMFEKSNNRVEQSTKKFVKEKKTAALDALLKERFGIQKELKAAKQEPPIAAMAEQRAQELEAVRLREEAAKEKKLYSGIMKLQQKQKETTQGAQPTYKVPAGKPESAPSGFQSMPGFAPTMQQPSFPETSLADQQLTAALDQLHDALRELENALQYVSTPQQQYYQPEEVEEQGYAQAPEGGYEEDEFEPESGYEEWGNEPEGGYSPGEDQYYYDDYSDEYGYDY